MKMWSSLMLALLFHRTTNETHVVTQNKWTTYFTE